MAFDQNFPRPNFMVGNTGTMNPQNSTMPSDNNSPFLNQWVHMPPSMMPWTMQNRPELVRFGEPSENESWPRNRFRCQIKRKLQDFPDKPAKVRITEEKMAAQLKNMHISKNYSGDQGFADNMDESSESMLPTLVLSKEVQSLRTFQQPIIPESIMQIMEKPTKALVLWQPPAGKPPTWNRGRSEEEGKDTTNNNETANITPDLNFTSQFTTETMATEMEL